MAQIGRDLEWDDDGDMVVDDDGDLKLATPERTVIQIVEFRVRSDQEDFEPHPFMPAGLSRYRGRNRSRSLADEVKEAIYYSLVKDARFARNEIFVDVVPIGPRTFGAIIFVQDYVEGRLDRRTARDPLTISFTMSLEAEAEYLIQRITGPKE